MLFAHSQFMPLCDAADDGGQGTASSGNPVSPVPHAGAQERTPTGGGRTLSQSELDAIMGGVRAEARETAVRRLLEELGVKDTAEARQLLTAGREAEGKISEAKAAAEAALERANERLLRSAVLMAAKDARFSDPEDCWTYIDRTKLTIDDQGQVQGVAEAVKAVAEAKKHLLAAQPASASGTPRSPAGAPPTPSDADLIVAKRQMIDYGGF